MSEKKNYVILLYRETGDQIGKGDVVGAYSSSAAAAEAAATVDDCRTWTHAFEIDALPATDLKQ